jgi:nicotinamidase-related amidase
LHIAGFPVFDKHKGDAFSNPGLEKYLAEKNIGTIFLTGADGEFCVHFTGRGARNRGFSVNAIKDAIAIRKSGKTDAIYRQYVKEGIQPIESVAQFGTDTNTSFPFKLTGR